MSKKITRRRLVGGLSLAAGSIACGAGAAARTPPVPPLSVKGRVAWHNRQYGVLSFDPARADAGNVTIRLQLKSKDGDDPIDKQLRELLRPLSFITVVFAWQPRVDILSPWQAQEVICPDGTRLAVEVPLSAKKTIASETKSRRYGKSRRIDG